ncbi:MULTISPECIES: hypothetical protein [unclassified Mesorhizobium]|uniref:hypothetical protein n=1 Tax=unclassified Mesorhizobium TaxID=325217 RepID=UPI003336486D
MVAIKKLPHRRWEVLRDLWIEYLPILDMSQEFPGPTLWDLASAAELFKNLQPDKELPYVEGIRESVFREIILLARKFSYCRNVARQSIAQGFPTWGVIAGYDACFYGAKAFCYLLGVVSVERHSKLFLDIFVPRSYKSGKTRAEAFDILTAHRLDEHLTHKMLWDITSRLCRTLVLPDNAGDLGNNLRELDFEKISNFRNNLIYDGGFWLNRDDYDHCDLTHRLSILSLVSASTGAADPREVDHRYFYLADKFKDALIYLLSDIGRLAPSIGAEVTALQDPMDVAA